jgi:phosphohistidine phosphatase
MELFLLRHAIAVERSLGDDTKRPLSREGAEKMRRIAKGMRRLELDFDLILSSPYLRARQTAEIAVRELEAEDKLKVTDHLAADADAAELVSELKTSHRSCKSVLLVGHEPFMSELISTLLSGKRGVPIVMKKGGLCHLTIESLRYGRCARLEWLLTPRQLARIGTA